jgi:hypothetical protein
MLETLFIQEAIVIINELIVTVMCGVEIQCPQEEIPTLEANHFDTIFLVIIEVASGAEAHKQQSPD